MQGSRQQRLFHPTFVVRESASADAWVYVDYAILRLTARDVGGDLLFQVPQVVDKVVDVEVYLRDRSTAPALDTPSS